MLVWLGIVLCVLQSAIFSGLNLACFSVSRLRLEIEAANGNITAQNVLQLREDSNLLLATVLWGNVGINVLLTILSNSVMLGALSFFFSTFVITVFGEILPQAYFSRHALQMASLLKPVIRVYQLVFYPIAKPTALLLDLWLGKESVHFMRENDLRQLIHRHIGLDNTDLNIIEGIGALNFLAIDDQLAVEEGERLSPSTVIETASIGLQSGDKPVITQTSNASLIRSIEETKYRWIILVDEKLQPVWALDSFAYFRSKPQAHSKSVDLSPFCHQPIVISHRGTRLGEVIASMKAGVFRESDSPFPGKVILFWGDEKRIITSSDILGRLFKGIGAASTG